MRNPRIINLSQLPWTPWSVGPGAAVGIKDPARQLGSRLAGLRLQRLQPGMQAGPLHRHHYQEEMFLILSGTGTLKHGNREFAVAPGDFLLYPAGDPVAHSFVNTGNEPLELIATGNRVPHEVCEYPEEGTVYIEALNKTVRLEEVPEARETREAWYYAGWSSGANGGESGPGPVQAITREHGGAKTGHDEGDSDG